MEVVIYATLTGSPAISLPVPLSAGNLGPQPGRKDLMGLQLIGAPQGDLGVLAAAAAYEAALAAAPTP
jgi:amidase